jgi:hypothetical protein
VVCRIEIDELAELNQAMLKTTTQHKFERLMMND